MLKNFLKRFITFILVLSITFTSLMGYLSVNAAGAMDRVKTYIALGAGKQNLNQNDINSLNKEELQFLGTYMSNYFIPFRTNIGLKGDEDTIKLKDEITNNLKTVLGFNEILSKQFGELLFSMVRGSSKTLDVTFQAENPTVTGNVEEVSPEVREMFINEGNIQATGNAIKKANYVSSNQKATYATLLASVFSTKKMYNEVFGSNGWNGDKAKYRYAVFYVQGTKQPVFVADLLGEEVTASEFVFLKGMQDVGIEAGYGMNLFDLGKNEIQEPSESVFKQLLEKTNTPDLPKYTIFGSELRVDCFGNLMYLGANNQYIIMNGASNPFTWRPVEAGSGNDFNSVKAGRFVNLTNLLSLDLYSRGDLFSSSYAAKVKEETSESGVSEKNSFNLGSVDNSNSKISIEGSEDVGGGLSMRANFKYNEDGEITIEELNAMANIILNPSILKRASFNKLKDITAEKTYFRGDFNNLVFEGTQADAGILASGFYKEYHRSKGASGEKEVINIFKDIASKVASQNKNTSDLQESGKTTSDGQNNYWGIGTTDFSTLQKRLNNHKITFDGTQSYSLNISRGSTKLEGEDPANKVSSINQFFSKAIGEEIDKTNYFDFNYIRFKDRGFINPKAMIYHGQDGLNANNGKKVTFYDSYALIDDLGVFGWGGDANKEIDYKAINFGTILENYDVSKGINEKSSKFIGDIVKNMKEQKSFSNNYSKIEKGGLVTVDNQIFNKVAVSMYVTYAYASLYDSSAEGKKDTLGKVGFRLNKEGLPAPEKGSFSLDKEAVEDMQIKSIRNWVYYLLHPIEGFKYVYTLIRNTINAVLVGLHEDIVGSRGTGIVAGSTKYKSSFGLVSLPEVSETEWMDGVIKFYDSVTIYLILLALVFAIVYWAIGMIEAKKALSGFAIACLVIIMLPTVLINSISWSNNIISAPYSKRFNHWALVQHQTYSNEIDKASTSGNYTGYLRKLNENNLGQNQGGDPVNIKWQAPKKMANLMLDSNLLNQDSSIGRVLKSVTNRAYSGEGYLTDKDAVFMYRSYLDLSNVSRYMYGSVKDNIAKLNTNPNTTLWTESLRNAYETMDKDLDKARTEGYLNSTEGELSYRLKAMLGAKPYNDVLSQKGTIKDMTLNDLVGISPNAFNFALPMYTKGLTSDNSAMKEYREKWTESKEYSDKDIASLGFYGIFSESPYYYFSFSLYDQGLDHKPNVSGGYKDLLLKASNAGYFYNNTANGNGLGEMKDYLDMRGLFTYVIPYLRQGNDIVREWDQVYGIKLYEGVSTKEEDLKSERMNDEKNAELRQKTWHNVNVARLYSIYTPWVDLLYDSKYAKPTTVNVLGKKVEVQDPLNPASYPKERPMIFSKSEQLNLGYKDSELTDVERKILTIQDKGMTKMYELLDYYGFNDNVVNSAVAMELTFIFNREFSDKGVFNRKGVILYPQNYEMTDFSHDAYLRLILANSTGESLYSVPNESFYKEVVDKSNSIVGIMLVISDIAGQFVLPVVKVLTVVGLLVLSFLIAITIAAKIKDKPAKYTLENWVTPLVKFLVSTIIFSYAIALMMPVGSGAISSNKFSIRLGDPTVAMGLLTVIVAIMCWVYIKILKDILKSVKETSMGIGALLVATATSIASRGKAAFAGGYGSTAGVIGSFVENKKENSRRERSNVSLAKQIAEQQEHIREKRKEERKLKSAMAKDNKTDNKNVKPKSNFINNTINKGKDALKSTSNRKSAGKNVSKPKSRTNFKK